MSWILSGMTVIADQIELGRIDVGIVVAGESSREPTEATIARLQDPQAGMQEFKDNLATLTLGSAGVAMILTSKRFSTTGHKLLGGIARAATQWHGLCVGTATKMTTNPTKLLSEGVGFGTKNMGGCEPYAFNDARCSERVCFTSSRCRQS